MIARLGVSPMMLDTTRISQEAQDVALDLMRVLDITKPEAFIYMIDIYAIRSRDGKRVEYEALPSERLKV
jgi:hypothetical protein